MIQPYIVFIIALVCGVIWDKFNRQPEYIVSQYVQDLPVVMLLGTQPHGTSYASDNIQQGYLFFGDMTVGTVRRVSISLSYTIAWDTLSTNAQYVRWGIAINNDDPTNHEHYQICIGFNVKKSDTYYQAQKIITKVCYALNVYDDFLAAGGVYYNTAYQAVTIGSSFYTSVINLEIYRQTDSIFQFWASLYDPNISNELDYYAPLSLTINQNMSNPDVFKNKIMIAAFAMDAEYQTRTPQIELKDVSY